MTILQALDWATQKLIDKKISSASLDAELLLSLALNQPKEFLFTKTGFALTPKQFNTYKKLINRRLKHIPIAYLTGEKEFYGYKFRVNKNVLVPRPVSEEIIDKALEIIKSRYAPALSDSEGLGDTRFAIRARPERQRRARRYAICDIGTGSGCLIISLANELKKLNILNNYELLATDVSKKALKVAQENAKLHQVGDKITFIKGKLLQPVDNRRIDLIIANLPYLTKTDIKREPSIKKEPKKALIGDYTKFFKQLDSLSAKPTVIYEDKNGINIFS